MKKHVGLLPAAGLALRMRPFRYPKELLPMHFRQSGDFIQPKLLIEYSLEAFSVAGIQDVYIVVPDWKPEIMRYLEGGDQFDHHIAYLYNNKALGLADALLTAYSWLKDTVTFFAMPDTMFSPVNAFQLLVDKMKIKSADLVLGVFPTDEANHFAPVEFDEDDKVLQIWEKPPVPLYNNAWGIAVWENNFWDYFQSKGNGLSSGVSITEVFNDAAKDGLRVYCVFFSDGWYKDVGRINQIILPK